MTTRIEDLEPAAWSNNHGRLQWSNRPHADEVLFSAADVEKLIAERDAARALVKEGFSALMYCEDLFSSQLRTAKKLADYLGEKI